MEKTPRTEEEKEIDRLRKLAVKQAKEIERERVKNNSSTRGWTSEEIEIIKTIGWPKGYEGHHM